MRRARVDSTHRAIVAALRAAGCSVQVLTPGGKDDAGLPDLLVGRDRTNFLIELKSARESLSEVQVGWHNRWRGAMPKVARTVGEALRVVGAR